MITEYELIELEEEIDRRKKEFNAKFRTLKTIREQLLGEIRHCDAQVNLLCQGIGTSGWPESYGEERGAYGCR